MEGKPNFENIDGNLCKKGISADDKKLVENFSFTEDADSPYIEHGYDEDGQIKVIKEVVDTKLESRYSESDFISQDKIKETIVTIVDKIDALELQLNYHEEQLGLIATEIRRLEEEERLLSDKTITLRGHESEDHANLVQEMNKVGEDLNNLNLKYEMMSEISDRNCAKIESILSRLNAVMSYSYETERSSDTENPEKVRTFLKN